MGGAGLMVVGVSVVRDEIDIIERTVEHMAAQLDALLIMDNGSTDGTREYLDSVASVTVFDDDERGHYQSRKLSDLAFHARTVMDADWVIPFDADERWLPNDRRERIADQLMRVPAEALISDAAVLDHVATGDPEMPWRRREQLPLRKVACRVVEGLVIGDGNHSAYFPDVDVPLTVTGRLEVRHYPYRSAEQMIRKARKGAEALAATDLDESIGAHWRDYGRLSDEQITETFYGHFYSEHPENDPKLVHNPCPRPLQLKL
jgi:glycosyltransferase involved in cell wall biosynthesis